MADAADVHEDPSAEDRDPAGDQGELAQQLVGVARSLQGRRDLDATLTEVVKAAVVMIPGVDEGSISVVTGRRDVTSQSPSSELPRLVDALQAEVGEGPCLDAVFEHQTVRVPDMASEQRWPHFAARAAEAGAASMLSLQLFVEGNNLGALNLYSRRPHAFDEESEHVGLMFAAHAAVAFAAAQRFDQMVSGLASRDLIGQAKGILMERYQISADQAFTALVRISQQRNLKLRDAAQELATTRRLPGLTGGEQLQA